MLGKVQDLMASAIVIGAADQAASSNSSSETRTAAASGTAMDETNAAADTQTIQQSGGAENAGQKKDDKEKRDGDPQTMDERSVSYMTQELNDLMSRINCNLKFQYHKEIDTMSVKMLDKKTGEVLKEVPPEDMIKHMIKAKDWLGAFLDKNA